MARASSAAHWAEGEGPLSRQSGVRTGLSAMRKAAICQILPLNLFLASCGSQRSAELDGARSNAADCGLALDCRNCSGSAVTKCQDQRNTVESPGRSLSEVG